MSLLIDCTTKDLAPWIAAFHDYAPEIEVVRYDEKPDFSKVTSVLLWNHRPELFKAVPNVKLIASMGAGVDHIVNDPNLPNGVPITRIVSDALSAPMSNYCIGAILHYQRQFDQYVRDKVQKRWHQEFNPEREMNVGIMGLGKLGQDLALKLLPLGFNVCGLSQSRKQIEGVKSFVMDEIDNFLSSVNILVVMLPATPETKGILSMPLFNKMRRGTFLINVARGFHQVDDDILTALDRGILDGAFLDVFPEEPLPQSSALWDHPKVMITPHIAVVTKVEAAVPQIVEAHRLVLAGKLPKIVVDLEKGY